jgi:hypothetical protein
VALAFLAPAADTGASRGGRILVELVANDPAAVATVEILADADGDAGTTGDQFPIATAADDNGMGQRHFWDAAGVPLGTYSILARMNGTLAAAPGRVTLSNLALGTVLRGRGGPGGFAGGAVATFPDGSFAIGGTARGTAVFGEGEPNETTLDATANGAGFVARHAADGALLWALLAGRGVQRIVAFPDGSLVACGWFVGAATFGAGEANETTLLAGDTFPTPLFLARYEQDGTLAWAHRILGVTTDMVETRGSALAMAPGPDGCAFFAGSFANTLLLGEGQAGETLLVSVLPDQPDIFVACVDAAGTLLWARSAGGAGPEWVGGIAAFPDGGCAIVGEFTYELAGLTSHGLRDCFVLRLSPAGDLLATTRLGGVNNANGLGIAPQPDGTCTVYGAFDLDMQAGAFPLVADTSHTPFLAVIAPDGGVLSARRLASRVPFPLPGNHGTPWLGGSGPDGSIVLSGTFTGTLTLGEGEPRETVLAAQGSFPLDAGEFVAVYNADGTLRWARANPNGTVLIGSRAALGYDGSVIFTAALGGTLQLGAITVDADPDPPYSMLVARINADGDY